MKQEKNNKQALKELGNYSDEQVNNILKGIEEMQKPENQKAFIPTSPELDKKLKEIAEN